MPTATLAAPAGIVSMVAGFHFGMLKGMLRYRVAYYLPRGQERMVVAEVLDFPGVLRQGFDFADARRMIASALEDLAQMYLEEGSRFPCRTRKRSRRMPT
jgi:predicted RNase H-like HicB family nuclease